jgi:hypothetical protein
MLFLIGSPTKLRFPTSIPAIKQYEKRQKMPHRKEQKYTIIRKITGRKFLERGKYEEVYKMEDHSSEEFQY